MARRRSRRNAFFGHPLVHRWAAMRGHRRSRRKGRRSRRNAGTLSIASVTRSAKQGFNMHIWKKAATILGGNISTSWSANKAMEFLPVLNSNPIFGIATVGLMAGVNGVLARRFAPRYADGILVGGILAAVTRLAKMVLPGHFATCGLSDDLDGLGDWFADPRNIGSAFRLGSYAHVGQPTIGMSDYAIQPQVQPGNVVQLDGLSGMANAEVSNEIASQM